MTKYPLPLTQLLLFLVTSSPANGVDLEDEFKNPPDAARPGVYWYFMDGNLDREAMTKDLESMKEAGIGNLIFLEVNVGVPRGPVDFMSEPWQDLFVHAVREAERLEIDITLGSGPGWSGSGGPWNRPENSMQHLVYSETDVSGPSTLDQVLPIPKQRTGPFHKTLDDWFEDVVVLAIPKSAPVIDDLDRKALYLRNPFSIWRGGESQAYVDPPIANGKGSTDAIPINRVVNLTDQMDKDGRLKWQVLNGDWTILRMARRITGSSSRPAPESGLGLECDKFDATALDHHYANYCGKLIERINRQAPSIRESEHGLTTLHIDSWEMGSQNWTDHFAKEFQNVCGYDPTLYLPAYAGRAVASEAIAERFLWDMRQVSQELILRNHAGHLKKLARRDGLTLSIEPYDMNPASDLDLGAVADVPMCEFWALGFYDTTYSCVEATSIAHVLGKPIVAAEAFTGRTQYREHPWSMKSMTDWAFCMGINRLVYHTFAHKPLGDDFRPGMTMGPYGTHWDRGQTFWPMVGDYHQYVSRCSHLLRQGTGVADILYLTPEGVPHIFRPPHTALDGTDVLADGRGFRFDGCSPKMLIERAEVRGKRIAFRNDEGGYGTEYRIMVLPLIESMTPKLLAKIESLIADGATVIGLPPRRSPSLVGFPHCDEEVKSLATKIWGGLDAPETTTSIAYGKGTLVWGGTSTTPLPSLNQGERTEKPTQYPDYASTATILDSFGLAEDFASDHPVRFIHRRDSQRDIYFVANQTSETIHPTMKFRTLANAGKAPMRWDPLTGETRPLVFTSHEDHTTIELTFAPRQSFFIVFAKTGADLPVASKTNLIRSETLDEVSGPWNVAFNPKWGGPDDVVFDALQDWTERPEPGIRYYSGIATYRNSFNYDPANQPSEKIYLDLGTVHDIARVRLNGEDLGVVWCAPWRVDLSSAVSPGSNRLEIEVANRWRNRLIGDRLPENAKMRTVQWDSGLLGGEPYKTGRYTFSTLLGQLRAKEPEPSGLLGPVRLVQDRELDGR
ncbi:glycosyl hydrolase [Novipirellula artificiosorum]|uniref:Beta-mannosidase-like galactose-binding domain-containing protein n=1 Tax=Novipirellula artificiosorum TaxID=2528016 RepID=A0A5C6DR69_9BACT|nr:glycosyl hydrolase [Novipirellula artificiosorum]TWU38367.1 hypothetical protein Poly41_28430 [Novipirellula artificiosorum]